MQKRVAVTVNAIETLSKGKRKIYLDNGEQWILYAGELHTYEITEQAMLSEEQYVSIRTQVLGKRAKKRAMYLLERMDRTEQQLRDKLRENAYPEDLIDEAIAYVKRFHYVDDARYADSYIRYRGAHKSKGKLMMELQQKGISRDLAEQVMEPYAQSRDEGCMIQELLQKRHYDAQTASVQEQRRMYAYLMRRGFRSADICREMKCET